MQGPPEIHQIIENLRFVAGLSLCASLMGQAVLRHKCKLADLPLTQRTDIANRILPLIEDLRRIWTVDNRVGNLSDSIALLESSLPFLLESKEA